MKYLILSCLTFLLSAQLFASSKESRLALYQSLDINSISEHIAYYELYKDFPEGKKALHDAWKLITKENKLQNTELLPLTFPTNIDAFVQLIQPNAKNKAKNFQIDENALSCIEELAVHLGNRKLKGHTIETEAELLKLSSDEIDLAHALFLLQFPNTKDGLMQRRMYEAALDLMALQVLARITFEATPQDKIKALNHFIFFEMGFRFPPHSQHEQAIDRYTFLPSVLESRRGVCLGVSIVYLSLAQRLNLPLEIVTPPGHIFVRYKDYETEINIETTLRGVHIPSDEYLGINEKRLKTPPLKEVMGMVYMNEASIFLQNAEWQKAAQGYENAIKYMPTDNTIKELLGCSYLFLGKKNEAIKLFEEVIRNPDNDDISKDTLAIDIVSGKVTPDALKVIFMRQNETRKSIVAKKLALIETCKKHPQFRSGLFQLASTYLKLQRPQEAIDTLEKLSALDPNDITCEYYLAALYLMRYNDQLSLKHLLQAEAIAKKANILSTDLQEIKIQLSCHGTLQETEQFTKN
jgi:regulator of sirC expression with transglutaminase-like and TPR domain